MRNLRKTIITALVFIAVIAATTLAVGGCGGDSGDSATTQTQTVAAAKGTLSNTVSAIGSISMPEQVNLTFGSGGSTTSTNTVSEINVEFGDSVKKGDVLAKIDTASLERTVKQAKSSLRTTQISLEQASSETNTLAAKAKVESAKAALAAAEDALDNALNPSSSDIAKAQAVVESSVASLASAEKELSDAQTPYSDSDIAQAEATVRDAQIALGNTRSSLTIAQKNGAINVTDAENSLSDAEETYDNYVQANIANLTRSDIAEQKDGYWWDVQKAQENLEIVKSQTNSSITTAENNVTKAEETLAKAKEDLAEMKADPIAIQQKQSAVATAKVNLAQAEDALAALQPDSIAIQQKQSAVSTAKVTLAQAEDDLAYIEAGHDIELAQMKVDNAQVELDDAQEQLEAATIIAPFDGVVAEVDASVGDTVTASSTVVLLVNMDVVQVDATVDETDVASVKAGQAVEITLDALPDAKLAGTVAAVSPLAQSQSSVVTYGLSIDVQNNGGYDLKDGMTASIDIVVLNKTGVLLIPSSAITQRGPASFVTVMGSDGKTEQRVIVTGETDGTNTEIVSGLSEGETVVVAASGTSSGKTLQTSSTNTRNRMFFDDGGGPPADGGGFGVRTAP